MNYNDKLPVQKTVEILQDGGHLKAAKAAELEKLEDGYLVKFRYHGKPRVLHVMHDFDAAEDEGKGIGGYVTSEHDIYKRFLPGVMRHVELVEATGVQQ